MITFLKLFVIVGIFALGMLAKSTFDRYGWNTTDACALQANTSTELMVHNDNQSSISLHLMRSIELRDERIQSLIDLVKRSGLPDPLHSQSDGLNHRDVTDESDPSCPASVLATRTLAQCEADPSALCCDPVNQHMIAVGEEMNQRSSNNINMLWEVYCKGNDKCLQASFVTR